VGIAHPPSLLNWKESMIKFYNKKKDKLRLLDLIFSHIVKRFYYTNENKRFIIKDNKTLEDFLSGCSKVIVSDESCETFNGVLALWKGRGEGIKRDYIKFNVLNKNILDKLLTYLFWYHNNEVFVKIKDNSKFLNVFFSKGFRKVYSNNGEILLIRRKYKYERQSNRYSNKNKVFNRR
jgi:hypothetical protein